MEPNDQDIETMISFDKFERERLSSTSPDRRQVPTKNQSAQASYYFNIGLLYRYGFGDKIVTADFLVEGPELGSPTGVIEKTNDWGKMEYSILVSLSQLDPKITAFCRFIDELHLSCSSIINANKGTVGLIKFNMQTAEAIFRHPVYRPYDKTTGNLIEGRTPSIYFKLLKQGGVFGTHTLFTDPLGKEVVDWNILIGAEIRFVPVLRISRIYVGGGKASLQMHVESAVITDIKSRNSVSRQTDTLAKLQARPELVDTVIQQISSLSTRRNASAASKGSGATTFDAVNQGSPDALSSFMNDGPAMSGL